MLLTQTPIPPCGWNSYDGYGCAVTETEALANLEIFIEKLKPFGFEYFCLDAGWYGDGSQLDHARLRKIGQSREMHIDEFGRYIPSPVAFPRGLRFLADRCHENGLKFGLHMMRGMPLTALQRNTPIKGTNCRARDIYSPDDNCSWCRYWCATDLSKPGAQEFYDSEVEYLANELTVDFIKLDDVTEHPDHVEAFARAIDKVERPILLSLSPGGDSWPGSYRKYARFANMMRVHPDVWDSDEHREKLARWYVMENCGSPECWLDFDMIPFGALQVNVPACQDPAANKELGFARQSRMSPVGKRTLMTILAMSASPLIFGGALPDTPDADLALVTHPEVLACNRNGIVGKRVEFLRHTDIRRVPSRQNPGQGWLGIFNVNIDRHVKLTAAELGFARLPELYNIWEEYPVIPSATGTADFYLPAGGCAFLKYSER